MHEFAFSRDQHSPDLPLHPLHPGDKVFLKTWRYEGPEDQLKVQLTDSWEI